MFGGGRRSVTKYCQCLTNNRFGTWRKRVATAPPNFAISRPDESFSLRDRALF